MKTLRVAALAAALAGAAAAAPPAPGSAPPSVEIAADGGLVHRPSGLKLPRGPEGGSPVVLNGIGPDGVTLSYGPVTVEIGAPQMAADPSMVAPGYTLDPAPPRLPALPLWGEPAAPVTLSWLNVGGGEHWMSFSVVSHGWQIVLSSAYGEGERDEVVSAVQALWATIASGGEAAPR